MKDTLILSLSGYARTGKDTAADVLQAHGLTVARVAYADAVRALVRDLYGVGDGTKGWWEEHKAEPLFRLGLGDATLDVVARRAEKHALDANGRDLLIHAGQSMRERDEDFWLDRGEDAVLAAYGHVDVVVITDARFTNEVWQAKTWRGHRGGAFSVRKVVTALLRREGTTPLGEADRAVDQIPQSYFDLVIHNNGSTDDLRDSLLANLRGFLP